MLKGYVARVIPQPHLTRMHDGESELTSHWLRRRLNLGSRGRSTEDPGRMGYPVSWCSQRHTQDLQVAIIIKASTPSHGSYLVVAGVGDSKCHRTSRHYHRPCVSFYPSWLLITKTFRRQLRDLIICPREAGIVNYVHNKSIIEHDLHAPDLVRFHLSLSLCDVRVAGRFSFMAPRHQDL